MKALNEIQMKHAHQVLDELAHAGTVLEQLSADMTDIDMDGNPPIGFVGAVGYMGKIVGALSDLGLRTMGATPQHVGGFESWLLGRDFELRQAELMSALKSCKAGAAKPME